MEMSDAHVASNNSGTITIYLCIILICCLFLTGVLIDAVRVFYACSQVNSALEASARSVLAGYHKGLVSDCGVFAVDMASPETQEIYLKYLENNLKTQNGFVKFEIIESGTEIKGYNWLSGNTTLKSQIIEYMKYRVPLSTAKSVIDKFKEAGLPDKSSKAKKASILRKKRSIVVQMINALNGQIRSFNAEGIINGENLGILEQKLHNLDSYARQVQNEISGYVACVSGQDSQGDVIAGNEFKGIDTGFERLFFAIDDNLRKIESIKLQILAGGRNTSEQPSGWTKSEQPEGRNSKKDENTTSLGASPAQAPSLKEHAEDADLGPCSQIEATMLEEISWCQPVDNEMPPVDDGSVKKAITLLNKFYEVYERYSVKINPDWLIDPEDVKRNEELDQNTVFNLDTISDYRMNEAEKANDGILSFAAKLDDMFEKATKYGIENVYINEYIMGQFSYVTSKEHMGHLLEKSEVEYILFRGNSQIDNIRRMAERLAFTRFAINSLDYFVKSENPHPVYRLIYSLARGMIQTGKDMLELYRGRAVSITPSASKTSNLLKMDYADYLRLFLLVQPENEKLNGIKQLVQFNMKQHDNNFKLTDFSTAVLAKVKVKVNLWFFSMIIPDRINAGPFKGNSFVIERRIYEGY